MRSFLSRRPIAAAVITGVVLLVTTQSTQAATPDVAERGWLACVIFTVITYAAFALWFLGRGIVADDAIPALRVAVPAAPVMAASALAFVGLPSWSLWATLLATVPLLTFGAIAGRPRRSAGESTQSDVM